MAESPDKKEKDTSFDPNVKHQIQQVAFITACAYIFQFIVNEGLFVAVATTVMRETGLSIYYFLRYVLPLPSLFFLFRLKKAGWILTFVYSVALAAYQVIVIGRVLINQIDMPATTTQLTYQTLNNLIIFILTVVCIFRLSTKLLVVFFSIHKKLYKQLLFYTIAAVSVLVLYTWNFT